ncbi:hypothetical protein DY000_02014613 [Brassica cretica]|uniref:Uncharacterized protein n=1 Tax=Brassica cretica TaxID=69181 RepID=A0ABQ7D1Y0_BRACR|nr:hypothetical protein DY000_02014613 [Brassica cretica]
MSSSFSLVSEEHPQFVRVLPIGTLSMSIKSSPSSEGILTVSGGLSEGLGLSLSALRRATSIFGICTQYVIGYQGWADVGVLLRTPRELESSQHCKMRSPLSSVHVSKSQPCLAAQYRSMFGLEYRSMSDGRCRSIEDECLRSTVIVVPCAVFAAESPIPPDRSMHISSYIDVLDDHQHVEASQRGLQFRDEVDKGPVEATSIDRPDTIKRHQQTGIDQHYHFSIDRHWAHIRAEGVRCVWKSF